MSTLMSFIFDEAQVRIHQDEKGMLWFVSPEACKILCVAFALPTRTRHDTGYAAVFCAIGIGDRVLIMETRPLSASKRWRVVEILEKAK